MATSSDVKSIFGKVLELLSPAEGAAYLDQACGADQALRADVERLLKAFDKAGHFMSQPAVVPPTVVPYDTNELVGQSIGPYKLLQKLGEGGMGTVYLAEQAQPVKRRVALKIIKAGMDSRQIIARFEQERQALAMMEHPNIARVLDAGATEAGLPFVVMELIKGVPITSFCDQERLTLKERLDLFVPVCQAVQHAHQKGIIHRDLKPSNVLIALYDGRPVPKVIDFGLAKATSRTLTERTLFTEVGVLVGTLEYMAPEQAELNNLDIDTRADIYSLGVILYEMLTGSTPFTSKQLRDVGFAEMLRLIKEVEPPKPSTKLSSSEELPSIAATRKLEPKSLTKLVTGELDWIVMKCLEKERGRRYETPNELAIDLQRYLADEPVSAGPPSARYRIRKFLSRHKASALAVSVILLTLIGGIIGTSWGMVSATKAKDQAQKRLTQIEKGIDILAGIFDQMDPWEEEKEARPLRVMLGVGLDQAANELDGEAVGDPLEVAKLQIRLGKAQHNLGYPAKAELLFRKAHSTRVAHLGAEDRLTLAAACDVAEAYGAAGKTNEAIDMFEQLQSTRLRTLGADHWDTIHTSYMLGKMYRYVGRNTEAVAILEPLYDLEVKKIGNDNPTTVSTAAELASAYLGVGKKTEAVALSERVWSLQAKKWGDDHPRTLSAMNRLGNTYRHAGSMKKALEIYEKARDVVVSKLGPDHPNSLVTLNNVAWMYRAYGRTDEAIALVEQVRATQVRTMGIRHPSTIFTLYNLGLAYRDGGRIEEALSQLREAAAGVEQLEMRHAHAADIFKALYEILDQQEQHEEADEWRRKRVAAAKLKDGPESSAYTAALLEYGAALLRRKQYAEAEQVGRECLEILQKQSPEALATFRAQLFLGGVLLNLKRHAEAEPLLLQAYDGLRTAAKAPAHRHMESFVKARTLDVLETLVELYDAWGKDAETTKWHTELEAQKTGAKSADK